MPHHFMEILQFDNRIQSRIEKEELMMVHF